MASNAPNSSSAPNGREIAQNSTRQPLPPTQATPEARKYAHCVWHEEFFAAKWHCAKVLGNATILDLEAEKQNMSEEEKTAYDNWKTLEHPALLKGINDELQKHVERCQRLARKYRRSRQDLDLPVMERPAFQIETSYSMQYHQVQKQLDVERAARHLSSEQLSFVECQMHNLQPILCEERSCSHGSTDLTKRQYDSQLRPLINAPGSIYTIVLPPHIAKMSKRTSNGRPDLLARQVLDKDSDDASEDESVSGEESEDEDSSDDEDDGAPAAAVKDKNVTSDKVTSGGNVTQKKVTSRGNVTQKKVTYRRNVTKPSGTLSLNTQAAGGQCSRFIGTSVIARSNPSTHLIPNPRSRFEAYSGPLPEQCNDRKKWEKQWNSAMDLVYKTVTPRWTAQQNALMEAGLARVLALYNLKVKQDRARGVKRTKKESKQQKDAAIGNVEDWLAKVNWNEAEERKMEDERQRVKASKEAEKKKSSEGADIDNDADAEKDEDGDVDIKDDDEV